MSSSVGFGTRILISTTISAFAFALVNFSLIYLHLPPLIYFSLAGLSNNGCNLVFGALWGLLSSILIENYGFFIPPEEKESSYRNFFKQFLFMTIFASCASIVFTFVQTFYFSYLPIVALSAVWLMIGSVLALNTHPGEGNLINIIFSSLIVIAVGFGVGLLLGIYFDFASIQGIFNQDWILMPVITSVLSLFVSAFLADNGVSRLNLSIYIALSTITLIAMISLSGLTAYYPLIVHLLFSSNFHFSKMFLIVDMRYFSQKASVTEAIPCTQPILSQEVKSLVKASYILGIQDRDVSIETGWTSITDNLKDRLVKLKTNAIADTKIVDLKKDTDDCVNVLQTICQDTKILDKDEVHHLSSLLDITDTNKEDIRKHLLYFNNLCNRDRELSALLSDQLVCNGELESISPDIKNALIDFIIARWTSSIGTFNEHCVFSI